MVPAVAAQLGVSAMTVLRVAPGPIGGQQAGRPAGTRSATRLKLDGGNCGGKPAAASCSGP